MSLPVKGFSPAVKVIGATTSVGGAGAAAYNYEEVEKFLLQVGESIMPKDYRREYWMVRLNKLRKGDDDLDREIEKNGGMKGMHWKWKELEEIRRNKNKEKAWDRFNNWCWDEFGDYVPDKFIPKYCSATSIKELQYMYPSAGSSFLEKRLIKK